MHGKFITCQNDAKYIQIGQNFVELSPKANCHISYHRVGWSILYTRAHNTFNTIVFMGAPPSQTSPLAPRSPTLDLPLGRPLRYVTHAII